MPLKENGVQIVDGEVVAVQGRGPGSSGEGNVAYALDYYGWRFYYQVPFMGGRLRGGQVLDFVIDTKPTSTVLLVHGRPWHGNKNQERDDLNMISLKANSNGRYGRILIAWFEEVDTIEKAKSWVLSNIGRT